MHYVRRGWEGRDVEEVYMVIFILLFWREKKKFKQGQLSMARTHRCLDRQKHIHTCR
jgi:hypothetical protein